MIVVAGEALVDLIARHDDPLVAIPGGGPFNAARAIARLGVRSSFMGTLSSDRFGRALESGLSSDGVELDLIQRTDRPTTLALAELDEAGAAAYRFYLEGTSAPAYSARDDLPRDASAVLVGALGLVLEPIATTLEALVASLDSVPLLMLDPNARPSVIADPEAWRARMMRIIGRTDVVKASAEDLEFLRPGATPAETAAELETRGVRVVLVTDGLSPVLVRTGRQVHLIDTRAVDTVDTVGAGDAFAGAFLACIVHETGGRRGLEDPNAVLRAVRFAILASSITCARRGADPPSLADVGGWPI